MSKAIEITETMGQNFYNGIDAEQYLQKLGWIVVRANDVYGLIGMYNVEKGKVYHLTEEQKVWLLEHYESMSPVKRQYVDEILDNDQVRY